MFELEQFSVPGGDGGWRGEFIEVHFDNSTKYKCNIPFGALYDSKMDIEPKDCNLTFI